MDVVRRGICLKRVDCARSEMDKLPRDDLLKKTSRPTGPLNTFVWEASQHTMPQNRGDGSFP